MKANKSIRETFLYGSMNKNGFLDKILANVLKKGKVLTPSDLSYEINTISKFYKYADKENVLRAFESGILKPIVLPAGTSEKVPQSIPFMLGMSGRQLIAYIFIDNYTSANTKDGSYSIDPKKLYCLLEAGYIATKVQQAFLVISRNSVLSVEGATIFAHMFTRVLNKKYALNVDKRAYSKVLYLAAKFFLINHLGMEANSDTAVNYAMKVADINNSIMVNELDNQFPPEAYTNLASFITCIHNNAYLITQSLANLTTRDYINDYVTLYQGSALFALEHLSYFLFTINSVVIGAYMNNQAILEDILNKSGVKIYNFISSLNY